MEINDPLSGDHLKDAEKELLAEKIVAGSQIDSIPEIPTAPDIAPGGRTKVPGTFKNRIVGLEELKKNEIPVAGQHFVVWGSKLLDDIQPRPVRKTAPESENAYAKRMRGEAEYLMTLGLKDPLHRGQGRAERAEDYARWRYRGFVAGEVASL